MTEPTVQTATTRATNKNLPGGATCPRYLTGIARKEWHRVSPMLNDSGILKAIDQSLLASYCQMFAHWRSSEDDIAANGLILTVESSTRTGRTAKPIQNPAVRNSIQFHKAMMQTAVKFGINPLDRPRIDTTSPDESDAEDEFEAFLNSCNSDEDDE